MPSPCVVDLEQLLTPIAGDSLYGVDLRWDPLYDEIKAARPKSDRDAFGLDEPADQDWSPVVSLTSEAIAWRTKDLMLAAWLTEALTHLHGFAGFRDGIKVVSGLLETYWEGLFPLPDGEDLEPRAAPIQFLAAEGRGARLTIVLRDVPLTPDRDESFCWNYWNARQQMSGESVEAFQRRSAEVEDKTRRFDEAVGRTPLEFARTRYDDLQEAQEELARLNKLVDEKFGDYAPRLSTLKSALDDCQNRVRSIVKDKGGFAEGASDAESNGHDSTGSHSGGGAGGPIRTREDAFRQLAEVAAFLRAKEPQNPIYLLVDRAVAWSKLPFDQLLAELIKDASARDQVSELLGIKPPG